MLSIKKLISKVLKCLYTTGSSGGWTWKKYADGTFEAWFEGNITWVNDGQLSSYNPTWWRSHWSITLPTAIGMVSERVLMCSNNSVTSFHLQGLTTRSGNTITQYAIRGGGQMTGASYGRCYIAGTWGGYCLTLLSAIERWWEHVRHQRGTCEDIADRPCYRIGSRFKRLVLQEICEWLSGSGTSKKCRELHSDHSRSLAHQSRGNTHQCDTINGDIGEHRSFADGKYGKQPMLSGKNRHESVENRKGDRVKCNSIWLNSLRKNHRGTLEVTAPEQGVVVC